MHMEHERVTHDARMSRWFFLVLMNRLPEAKEQQDKICVTHIQLLVETPFHQIAYFRTRNWPKIRFLVDGMRWEIEIS